jgi:zinc protease
MIPVQREILSNGVTLLFVETHQAPVTSINICLRVGSRMETDEEAGICHLIEHMLFKGTEKLPPGDVARLIEAGGGDVNAYTSFDETVYYCTLSSRYTDRGLEVLSDAVLNSIIDQTELDREREVVVEEILRGKDSPTKVLSEEIFAKAFPHHNYGRPIIGFEKTVRGFSRQTILDFYHRWYTPKNMVVVIAGDFKTTKMRKRCERIFGGLRSNGTPQGENKTEKPQKIPRALTIANPIQGSHMALAYHTPELEHEDVPALDILSHILGEGESCRLDMEVKEKRGLVNGIYSYVYSPKDPGLFYLGYSLPEKNIAKATRAVLEQIVLFQEKKVDHDELLRAKLNIKSDSVYEKETVEGLARKYGYFENILGRYDFDEHYYQAIDKVSVDDVMEVAQRYLHPGNLTMGLIHPRDKSKAWRAGQLLEFTKPKAKARVKTRKTEEIQHLRLKNGLRLIFRENPTVPTVVIRTAQLGGLRTEHPKDNGINSLLTQLWGKSTVNLDAQEMARQSELIAGSIDSYTGRNLTGMKADFLSEKTREGVHLFLEAYTQPRWDKQEIQREKENILEAIRRENDALASLTFKLFMKELYPTHPYGMPLLGEANVVRSLDKKDLIRCFDFLMNPTATVISVVGDFDTSMMLDLLAPTLEKIPRTLHRLKAPKADPLPPKPKTVEKVLEKFQAHIVYGFRGVRLDDPDRYALDVLNNVLSGQGGRLFLELRDKMSLAYSVNSLSQEGIEPGYFGVYIGTEGSKVQTAIAGIEKELKKVLAKKVKGNEIKRAQQYMIGAYEIELQRNASVATQLAFNEIYGMPRNEWLDLPKKILRVTAEDVHRVARKIIQLDHRVLSVVRPPTN